jgi:hypothetical protein
MAGVVALLVFVGCILAFLGLLFWYGLKGESNTDPAIGTNRPYPDGLGPTGPGAELPPYLPTMTISDAETFRRGVDRRLARLLRRPPLRARSWMDEPGALEAAGLVDAPLPATEPVVDREVSRRRHRHRKQP